MVKKISDNEFAEVKEQSIALIDFSAGWCGPCKMLAPVLEEVSESMDDKIAFYNVDVDDCADLAQQFEITNIPALVIVKNGVKVDMSVGFKPKDGIEAFINANL